MLLALCLVLLITQSGCNLVSPKKAALQSACVVIDNDFDIDDMMAIPAVIANREVAAIIQTEGVTLPAHSAPALDALVNRVPDEPRRRPIPIIVGGGAQRTDLGPWPWLPFFRTTMNHANALLARPPVAWPQEPRHAQRVAQAVAHCQRVSVLVLGPLTSFVQYVQLMRDRIERIVLMGRPPGDAPTGADPLDFNCGYDLEACQRAMEQIRTLPAQFVDVPGEQRVGGACANTLSPAPGCYSPSLDMVVGSPNSPGLKAEGLPGRLRLALVGPLACDGRFTHGMPRMPEATQSRCSALSSWVPEHVSAGPGGESLLWDQSAMLFFLFPERFSPYRPSNEPIRGATHFEPIVVDGSHARTAQQLRSLWTAATNGSLVESRHHHGTPAWTPCKD